MLFCGQNSSGNCAPSKLSKRSSFWKPLSLFEKWHWKCYKISLNFCLRFIDLSRIWAQQWKHIRIQLVLSTEHCSERNRRLHVCVWVSFQFGVGFFFRCSFFCALIFRDCNFWTVCDLRYYISCLKSYSIFSVITNAQIIIIWWCGFCWFFVRVCSHPPRTPSIQLHSSIISGGLDFFLFFFFLIWVLNIIQIHPKGNLFHISL